MIKNRTQFYFIRHGETEHNRTGLFAGTTDVPLNATGLAQAQNAAQLLRNFHFKTIIASPMQRAWKTAQIIGSHVGLEPLPIEDLRECGLGTMEEKPYMATESWVDYVQRWKQGFTHEGAESYQDFAQRVVRGVNDALAYEGPVLVVAHGGVGSILWHALGAEAVTMHNATPYRLQPHSVHETQWLIEQLSHHSFDEEV